MNAQQLWQSQSTEAPRVTLAFVRHQAHRLEQRTRLRNAGEYLLGSFCVVFCAVNAWSNYPAKPIAAGAMAWFALFALYAMWQWSRRAGGEAAPSEAGVLDTLRYQRRELVRQRDARLRNWRWWLPPALPGFILIVLSAILESGAFSLARVLGLTAWMVAGTGIGIAIYERTARRLQREIDALDSLAGQ